MLYYYTYIIVYIQIIFFNKKKSKKILNIFSLKIAINIFSFLQFIQTPDEIPLQVLRLTIPPAVLLHQFALAHYLRQNLQMFLFVPKYIDNRQEQVFKNYLARKRDNTTSGGGSRVTSSGGGLRDVHFKAPPLPENDVFLYNRPKQSGGRGL